MKELSDPVVKDSVRLNHGPAVHEDSGISMMLCGFLLDNDGVYCLNFDKKDNKKTRWGRSATA